MSEGNNKVRSAVKIFDFANGVRFLYPFNYAGILNHLMSIPHCKQFCKYKFKQNRQVLYCLRKSLYQRIEFARFP